MPSLFTQSEKTEPILTGKDQGACNLIIELLMHKHDVHTMPNKGPKSKVQMSRGHPANSSLQSRLFLDSGLFTTFFFWQKIVSQVFRVEPLVEAPIIPEYSYDKLSTPSSACNLVRYLYQNNIFTQPTNPWHCAFWSLSMANCEPGIHGTDKK